MGRKKGPSKADEWEEALEGELSCAKVEYLKRGKLKKCDYRTLLSRINDCVIDNLNASLKPFAEGREDVIENLYRLEVLADTIHNVSFFQVLDFIKNSDKEDIARRVKEAIDDFLSRIEIPIDCEDADLIYHLNMLKRAADL